MITPEEINNKQFSTRMRGYDADEVDDFLDRVTAAYSDALRRLDVSLDQLDRVTQAPTQAIPTVIGDVDRLLQVAQRTADEQIAEANGQAGHIIAQARLEAEGVVAQGHEERHAIVGKLEVQRSELEQSLAQLGAARAELGDKMRTALQVLEQQ